jgi:type I phosphodiesterase/nucleotide pyrophosphatase
MGRRALAALALFAATGAAPGCSDPPRPAAPRPATSTATPPPPARAPVVVTIVIDQFAAWIADERLPLLPSDGGFARLAREGTYVREARFDQAVTDTAPGHAALYTGAPPRESGIFANEISLVATGRRTSVLSDPSTKVVGPAGPLAGQGSSPARLRAETLADRLRASAPGATIVSLSLKDRAAIPGGGRRPDASVWFDSSAGSFVTSTAFAQKLPPWAARLAKPAALAAGSLGVWSPLDAAWLGARAGVPDDQPGEGDWLKFGTTFPHKLASSSDPSMAYRATHFGDDDLFALALAALDAPRPSEDEPFLLAVSLSSHDYVAHMFGPDSWEELDEFARLDRSLGAFLGELDRRFGPSGYAVLVTGDHGSAPTPEATASLRRGCRAADRWQRPCSGGGRLSTEGLAEELKRAAERALGPGAWVLSVADPYVVLGEPARSLPPLRRAVLDAALREAMARHPESAGLISVDELGGACPPRGDESLQALICRSVPAREAGAPALSGGAEVDRGARVAGDYYIVFQPGGFFEAYTPGKGSNHGSHYLYDRTVPLFARAPGRVRAGQRVPGPLPTTAFARTAADLLGIEAPGPAKDAPSLVAPAKDAPSPAAPAR